MVCYCEASDIDNQLVQNTKYSQPLCDLISSTNVSMKVDEGEIEKGWMCINKIPVGNVCKWSGVRCDHFKKIKAIDLSGFNISGTIPDSIDQLTNLEFLHLDSNSFYGAIPSSISNIERLMELHLFRNKLNGTIPFELGNMKNLKSLYLNENQLSGTIPVSFGNLESILFLILHNNSLVGPLPEELGQLDVSVIDIAHNYFDGTIPYALCEVNSLLSFGNSLINDCESVCLTPKCKRSKITNDLKGKKYLPGEAKPFISIGAIE